MQTLYPIETQTPQPIHASFNSSFSHNNIPPKLAIILYTRCLEKANVLKSLDLYDFFVNHN